MQMSGRYKISLVGLMVIENLVIINITYLLLFFIFPSIHISDYPYTYLLLFINIGYLFAIQLRKIIVNMRHLRLSDIIRRVSFRVAVILCIAVAYLFLTETSNEVPRLFILIYFLAVLFLIVLFEWLTREILYYVLSIRSNRERAVILGAGSLGRKLYKELKDDYYLGVDILGFFDDNSSQNRGNLLGNISDVKTYVLENRVSKIYCTLPVSARESVVDLIEFSEDHIISFHIVPILRHYMATPIALEKVGNIPVLSVRRIPLAYAHNAMVKRFFDVVLSAVFLLTLFPIIYFFVAIAIKVSSPGPVFFKQLRTGKDGRNFKCYKFRSMRVNKESDTKQATADDGRKTRIGGFLRRTNMDELPQFINVFKGDMSIVGPRPHMLYHTSQYSEIVNKYMVRHFIKPGITGLAQINGFRGETQDVEQMEKRVQKDIWYLENWSLLLDISIIIKTVVIVFKGDKKAY